MTPELFIKLTSQIKRQLIEQADYQAQIDALQPGIDEAASNVAQCRAALDESTLALQTAQARPEDASEDWQTPECEAEQARQQADQQALTEAEAVLSARTTEQAELKLKAKAIGDSIAHCETALSGVDMPSEALDAYAASIEAAQRRAVAKVRRAEAVDRIVVTTSAGHSFDGDEVSQGRMARAIIALQATGTPSERWVLADNTVIDAPVAELVEALALAGAAQAALWVL
jgi:hypothetical protein